MTSASDPKPERLVYCEVMAPFFFEREGRTLFAGERAWLLPGEAWRVWQRVRILGDDATPWAARR